MDLRSQVLAGGFGWFGVVLSGCNQYWLVMVVVAGFGWFWMMLGGFVLFCLVVTDFRWFWLVACFITNGGSSEKAASFQVS